MKKPDNNFMALDNLFDRLFDDFPVSDNYFYREFDTVRSFFKRKENQLTLNIPGYTKDDLEVLLEDRVLIVKGEKENFQKVHARYAFEKELDPDSIKARVENGILYVDFEIPRTSRTIEIS